ncbi:murein L,D-transpeptidase [Arcicella rosea]|uniref:Murein L,D-transpeptidase YcbB/YkuD n=1 Tax=Arcicella rosea TaxID=502909 RepID=A0A841EES9_9BACT|nr:L,D-transpeptidase family protein [Arcicella rosea]MBB6002677.1 murein L,D-transpeptidase YcbB/YkuD [Arcicella rosea]
MKKKYVYFKLFTFVFVLLMIASCDKEQKKRGGVLPDSSIYTPQNFTDLVMDSSIVNTFLSKNQYSDTIQNEVKAFYSRRNFQFAWLSQNGLTHSVTDFYHQLSTFQKDFADSSLHNSRLEDLVALAQNDEKKFVKQKAQAQELELLLTSTFFKYAEKAYGGIAKNTFDLEWFIPRKKKNYQALLDSLVSLSKGEKVQEPVNQFYIRLKDKLREYRSIQRKGAWQEVITDKKRIAVGDSDSCVVHVKKHLLLTGDLRENDGSIAFTDSLGEALKKYQSRMGLAQNGNLDAATIKELNLPIEARIKQIMINMERLRWVPVEIEKDYLLVNIPEFRLHIFENGKKAWAMNVVVGKAATQTSIFKGNLSTIVLNPYWGIPTSIVRHEILSKLKRNPNYLANNNMEVLSGNTVVNPNKINWKKYKDNTNVPFTFRQKPGDDNALGKIKFLFPNNFSIYLHDTPSKGLFNESKRAFSHGCIRVAEPNRLALYLLRKDSTWNENRVNKILSTDKEYGIRVRPTVPVYIVYFTTWVDSAGQINFRKDLYDLDKKLSKEIFGSM